MRSSIGLLLAAACLAAPGEPAGQPLRITTIHEVRSRAAADSLRRHLAPIYADALLAVESATAARSCREVTRLQTAAITGLTVAFAERTDEAHQLRWALREADSARGRR